VKVDFNLDQRRGDRIGAPEIATGTATGYGAA
jgi:hypothetical protein